MKAMVLSVLLVFLSINYISAFPMEDPRAPFGVIQREVRRYLMENPTEDETFVVGAVCTIESAPSFSDEKIEECAMCWPLDVTTEDGIEKNKRMYHQITTKH